MTLRRGKMEAVIFLPDKDNGYYRATRFDWSGVVACVAVNGHKFFGEWFAKYDPLKNDSITGPVEEFRTDNGVMGHYPPSSPLTTIHTEAIGYDEAKAGRDLPEARRRHVTQGGRPAVRVRESLSDRRRWYVDHEDNQEFNHIPAGVERVERLCVCLYQNACRWMRMAWG